MRRLAALSIAMLLPLSGARAQSVFDPRFHTIFPADNAMSLIHPCNALPESFIQKLSGTWTPGDAWWDVGVPEVSKRKEVRAAKADMAAGKARQRIGV